MFNIDNCDEAVTSADPYVIKTTEKESIIELCCEKGRSSAGVQGTCIAVSLLILAALHAVYISGNFEIPNILWKGHRQRCRNLIKMEDPSKY